MIKLEVGKTYETYDGRKATVLGATADERYAVVIEGRKMLETYGPDGTFRISSDREADEGLHLIREVGSKRVYYVNVYPTALSRGCASQKVADMADTKFERISLWRIECDEDGSNPEIFVEEPK